MTQTIEQKIANMEQQLAALKAEVAAQKAQPIPLPVQPVQKYQSGEQQMHAAAGEPCRRCAAYATLVKAQETQLSHHRSQADKYREAVKTLESEREANAKLTAELRSVAEEAVGLLDRPAGVPDEWREDVELAAQMLTWGDNDGGLLPSQLNEMAAHQRKLLAMLAAAPEAPAVQADLVKDAARYRYLRNDGAGFDIAVAELDDDGHESWVHGYPPDELDEAIDSAIKAPSA